MQDRSIERAPNSQPGEDGLNTAESSPIQPPAELSKYNCSGDIQAARVQAAASPHSPSSRARTSSGRACTKSGKAHAGTATVPQLLDAQKQELQGNTEWVDWMARTPPTSRSASPTGRRSASPSSRRSKPHNELSSPIPRTIDEQNRNQIDQLDSPYSQTRRMDFSRPQSPQSSHRGGPSIPGASSPGAQSLGFGDTLDHSWLTSVQTTLAATQIQNLAFDATVVCTRAHATLCKHHSSPWRMYVCVSGH